jgi:hypothetical protein
MLITPFLVACSSMKIDDFKGTTPDFVLEEYFAGKTQAWGIFEDRFGSLRRQFVVDITGTWDGQILTLDEHFVYSDGEIGRRVWTIKKLADGLYDGTAADVIGSAVIKTSGQAANFNYLIDLKVGDGTLRVRFDDWLWRQDADTVINRARVTKWGFDVGEASIFFRRATE